MDMLLVLVLDVECIFRWLRSQTLEDLEAIRLDLKQVLRQQLNAFELIV